MSANTMPRRHVTKIRTHDYLYDSSYIVSGARDYARTAFKSAMKSAQMVIQPIYSTMFSELPRHYPRIQIVYHPNCRLPHHIDRSYSGYVSRTRENEKVPPPQLTGRHRFMFSAMPKEILPLKCISPDFQPPSYEEPLKPTRPVNKGIQTLYRESSAQTYPWQPDGRLPEASGDKPEITYLNKLEWGPGNPFRVGDLPPDFHTTEIINKMRHARAWNELIEKGNLPKGIKRSDQIIADVETRDWLFREAEIDELQNIRLSLLHKLQSETREKKATRSSDKLSRLWLNKKEEMNKKIAYIHRNRDRELRKLSNRVPRNRSAQPKRSQSARSIGHHYDLDVYAPLSRQGFQAKARHAQITYDLSLLEAEDHINLSTIPKWLENCGQNLKKSCSGRHLPKDMSQLCERETKWNEQLLENLHNDLKKARLGAQPSSDGPLRILKRRQPKTASRAQTPDYSLEDTDQTTEQHALVIQSVVKGRAVQNLMYEGRCRATELIEELKSTHGLQKEDRDRIAAEESKAREYHDKISHIDKKEAAISALVEELCGGAVSAALDFLDKELKRLKEERRQHAFILVAMRDKLMREAAEAGKRQKEEQRRKEHDEMFSRVIGVTQQTVDIYLREIIEEGIDKSADIDAEAYVIREANKIDASLTEHGSMSTAEQNETIAELVHHFLLPEAHKAASRQRIDNLQKNKMAVARDAIFNIIDRSDSDNIKCTKCGDICRCNICPVELHPEEKPEYRNDPRWKYARRRDEPPPKDIGEKFPPYVDFRHMLNNIVDEAVLKARFHQADIKDVKMEYNNIIKEKYEVSLEVKSVIDNCIDKALGLEPPARKDYRHYMRKQVIDALERSQPFSQSPYHKQLPSEIRTIEEAKWKSTVCKCDSGNVSEEFDRTNLLPSEIRILEEFRKCKCDHPPTPSPDSEEEKEKEGEDIKEKVNQIEEE